jgi:hypothetical protein
MSSNYLIKYRTFDELLADASSDFKKYQSLNLIDPQDLIKVARKVNYELGLRIQQTRERVLEVEKGRVRLPNDFYSLEFALLLTDYTTKQYAPQGTQVEERIIGAAPTYKTTPPEQIDLCTDIVVNPDSNTCHQCGCALDNCEPCNACCSNPESCHLDCKGNVYQVVQTLTSQTRYYTKIVPLRILEATEDINEVCPNLYWESPYSATIRSGWLHTSFQTGKIYLNYLGQMEDAEGNLLVLDHPLINEFYEYAVKQRILENLLMNDEDVNPNKIQLIETRLRVARIQALNIVNMPDFKELKELFRANRNANYSKYYDMFSSYPRVNPKYNG